MPKVVSGIVDGGFRMRMEDGESWCCCSEVGNSRGWCWTLAWRTTALFNVYVLPETTKTDVATHFFFTHPGSDVPELTLGESGVEGLKMMRFV